MTRVTSRLVAGLVGAALCAGALLLLPRAAAAQGLLLSIAVWSGLPLGALAWLMINKLTGGAWGLCIRTPLCLSTRLIWILVAALALLGLLQTDIYGWMTHPVPQDRGSLLSPLGFNLRALAILLVWSWLAASFGWRRGSMLIAALGLTLYGVTISLASADWFMSIDSRRVNTSIGAMVALQQLLTALAVCTLYLPSQTRPKVVGDLAGLMIACMMGVLYLELMTYIIHWYGNLPQKVEWYLHRTDAGSMTMLALALACAGVALGLLILDRQRKRSVQIAALLSLAAIAAHWMWLLVPDFTAAGPALVSGVLGLVALTLLTLAAAPGLLEIVWLPDTLQHNAQERARPTPLKPVDPRRPARQEKLHSPEAPDIAVRPVLATAAGFCLFVALSMGALRLYFAIEAPRAITGLKPAPAATSLMIPEAQAQDLKAEQQKALATPRSDTTSLPIERAMQIIAARGAQAYEPVSPALVAGAPR